MKSILLVLCVAIASSAAMPTQVSQSSALDLLKELEQIAREDGKILMGKMLNVIHHIESGLQHVKETVPKVHEKIHQEADNVLTQLKKITAKVEEFLGKQKARFGFDLLGSLTSLSGGTQLSTVLDLLSLADKAHKVVKDAQEFTPHLQSTLDKIQGHIETHVKDFASHVVKELGLQDFIARSMMKKIEDLFEKVEHEAHMLILDLLLKMGETLNMLEENFPNVFEKVKEAVEEVRDNIHDLVVEVEQSLVMRSSFNLLDLAGGVTEGTSLGTAIKVASCVDKFNTVVQDVKGFDSRAEQFLEHSVKKVADSAQDFFTHAAEKLFA